MKIPSFSRWIGCCCLIALSAPGRAAEPAKTVTNSIGMEFVLIPAGQFTYGRFAAPFPAGGRMSSGLTEAQFAAVTKLNAEAAVAQAVVLDARNALTESSLMSGDRTRLETLTKALGDAELALATLRADAVAGIQRSPAKLPAPALANLVQQASALPANGRGGRGGGGGNPADIALAETLNLKTRSEYPGFLVAIPRPFYLGKFEVTQDQWKKVMGANPSTFQEGKFGTTDADRHPVESISWEDAKAFVKKLNELEKTNVYRLPTEFEWEYAGKAGSPDDATWDEIRQGAVLSNARVGTTSVVGTKVPNRWGLYDMLGNVWEWVDDFYNEKLYNDQRPPRSGKEHVIKGGSFLGDVKNVVYTTHAAGPAAKWEIGLRVVREAR